MFDETCLTLLFENKDNFQMLLILLILSLNVIGMLLKNELNAFATVSGSETSIPLTLMMVLIEPWFKE